MNDDQAPWCYLDKKSTGYTAKGQTKLPHGGFESTLELKTTARKLSPHIEQISKLHLAVTQVSEHILRIKLTDPAVKRYEVPIQSHFNIPTKTPEKTVYDVSLADDFHLKVTRKSNGATLIDTSIGGLVYSDQFIQFATYLASKDAYGFGENYHLSFKREFDYTTLPLFSRDHGVGDKNMHYYGQHPVISIVEGDGRAYGIFLLSSNAMCKPLIFLSIKSFFLTIF